MSEKFLYDNLGNVIGRIVDNGTGTMYIYTSLGEMLGTYEEAVDMTYDKYGNVVGRGNLLTTLLR